MSVDSDGFPGSTASSHLSALLVSGLHTNKDAQSACQSLHETLLPTTATGFSEDLGHLLEYQVFQGHFLPSQLFWVEGTELAGLLCNAVNVQGQVVPTLCVLPLPTLCSQSAVVEASPSFSNEVTVHSNGLTLTG